MGGIVGIELGYNSSPSYNPIVDISNCYSIGAIVATGGGIVGGKSLTYNHNATINITNCYGYDNVTSANSRIIATSYTNPTTQTNCYAPTTGWTDASANASLSGYPTSLTSGNPGSIWTSTATNTPYIMSSYNAALYSPNSASSSSNYTSSAGLFSDPSYNYQIIYTSQTSNVATTLIFVSKGTSPKYYAYNSNTFTLTNTNGGTGRQITATINSSTGALSYILPYPCFLEGTKILCLKNNIEQYRPIESLRKGDLVKTIANGYMPIYMIGTKPIYNPGNNDRIPNRLYRCTRENYPALFEDLYITGCHSILVPSLTEDQWNNTKDMLGDIYVTNNHFRLMACIDEKAEPFNKEGVCNIYHIALENTNYYWNYGIYANGLLVETCSKRYLSELSNMRILGEEDSAFTQPVERLKEFVRPIQTY
jgi:hypothetical protein